MNEAFNVCPMIKLTYESRIIDGCVGFRTFQRFQSCLGFDAGRF